MSRSFIFRIITTLFIIFACNANAGVVVGGTRLVYDGARKESSLRIENPDQNPYLIQSWVDTTEGVRTNIPFIITPPLFRLDAGQDNILRVIRVGGNLPEDRESLYWLNVKAIPSSEKKDNTLQIAIKTRIKFIYRPASIKQTPEESAKVLAWHQQGKKLVVKNNSPFYFTFFSVKTNGVKLHQDVRMVSPLSELSFDLPNEDKANKVEWQIINDFGGASKTYSLVL
ncbi:molecular chaperone [Atlantibacter hermannii]|uniref:fimbrial biogenesis chaperone n=1 Tax=Atlantibacter hermannii TaxID=565 RepID=UPI002DBD7F68|nr:molecular chaperone [Atlantibacter hermannii]MEB7922602.1 molecular chaperone [Atlantibacter hermannii]